MIHKKPSRYICKISIFNHKFIVSRQCNDGKHPLKGITLDGSVYSIRPFLEVNFDTMAVEGGVTLDIFKTIANYYDFNYTIRFTPKRFQFHPNGSISGALGEVILIPY